MQELPHLSLEAVRGLKGTKEASLQLQLDGDTTKTVRVAVCSGVVNARKLVEDVRAGRANYDFVEVRASLPERLIVRLLWRVKRVWFKVCSGVVNARKLFDNVRAG